MGRVTRIIIAAALMVLPACDAADNATARIEYAHLAASAEGAHPRIYTLADETRPVLSAPPETRLRVTVPAGQGKTYDFALPVPLRGVPLIASGVFQRARRVHPVPPQRLVVDGATATIRLPPGASGPGAPTVLTLALTRPPTSAAVEQRTNEVLVPANAELHLAYALTEAAAVPASGPVILEIEAVQAERVHQLWSTTVSPDAPTCHRWRELAVPLEPFRDQRVTFTFRARLASDAPAVLVPLWGDPTIVALGTRAAARRNVILISVDTLRADRVGVYGAYRPTTPGLDALAAEAAVLTNAWAPWPETSGSHMSLFTSRYPSEHGVTGFITAPATSIELMAERLRREGYLTRAFTEDGGVWANAGFARGFSAYSERRSPDFVYRGEAAGTFGDAITWLEANTDRIFFLFVHTYEVHAPHAPHEGYRALFTDIAPREPGRLGQEALAYDRETRYLDDQMGRLLDAVRRLDLDRRSIVIITSDHGEEFGEHGGYGHGRTLHREVLHVPLIIWAPGLVPAARIASPVSLIDIAPTVLDLLALPPDPTYRGRSLGPTLRNATDAADGAALRDRVLFAEVDRVDRGVPYRRIAARRGGQTAILDLADESVRCYGRDDPGETHPRPECADLVRAIVAHSKTARPPSGKAPNALDPRLVEKMRALGYLE